MRVSLCGFARLRLQRAVHRAAVGNAQQALALLGAEVAAQANAPGDALDAPVGAGLRRIALFAVFGVNALVTQRDLPPAMGRRIRSYLASRAPLEAAARQSGLLGRLSARLRGDVAQAVGRPLFVHVPYLRARPFGVTVEADFYANVYLALERFGYDITDGHKAVEAFQRRWRPEKIDGEIDGEVRAILFQLLLDRDRGNAR